MSSVPSSHSSGGAAAAGCLQLQLAAAVVDLRQLLQLQPVAAPAASDASGGSSAGAADAAGESCHPAASDDLLRQGGSGFYDFYVG